MAKNKVNKGRPTKLTDEVRRKIEEVAALDGSVEEMAYYSGVHRTTLYNWLQEDKDFFDRIQELRERPVLKARQTIVKALDDPQYAHKYLEKKRRKEFGQNIDVTTDGDKLAPLLVKIITNDERDSDGDTRGV